jgi:hypothetical protein
VLCPDCGHAEHFHRANSDDARVKLDDPVPCFAVVWSADVANTRRYRYCGCTTILPLYA